MRNIVVMAMFGYLGLGFPDVDLMLIGILHHRSIVTHSILLPAIFLWMKNKSIRFGAAGFILGISVHLAADVLSSPIGFGMVWLPWPVKFPLGPASPIWLTANALVGLVWSKIILLRQKTRVGIFIYISLAVLFSITYALLHEKSIMPFCSFIAIFALGFALATWINRQPWFAWFPKPPQETTPDASQ